VEPRGLRIDFARSGGFAGLTLETTVDTAELTPEERAEAEGLVSAVEATNVPEGTRPGVDRFQYDLTITRGSDSKHISVGENDLTPEVKALSDWLLARARRGD
jgi:hypothetical protein